MRQVAGPTILAGERIARGAKLRLSCAAAIVEGERVLMTQRSDNARWCLPSGGLDAGESVAEACAREVLEETGLRVELTRLIGIYSDPNRVFAYPDNVWHVVELLFSAKVVGGTLRLTGETLAARFCTREEAIRLDLLENDRERLGDIFSIRASPVIS
jgi:8-oxo-dGTP pyrophosphatase MutT (NUDIX family)